MRASCQRGGAAAARGASCGVTSPWARRNAACPYHSTRTLLLQLGGCAHAAGDTGACRDRWDRLVELTDAGRELLRTTRARREGWLTDALARELEPAERALLADALALLRRIANA